LNNCICKSEECLKKYYEIAWRKANTADGPDIDGWSLSIPNNWAPCYENIKFCPLCGDELPDLTLQKG